MKNIWKGFIWKGLIGFGILLLGLVLWNPESFPTSLTGELLMGIGFFLIFFGPVFFWIILPLKDRWYKLHPKRFTIAITSFAFFLLIIIGVIIVVLEPKYMKFGDNIVVNNIKFTTISASYTDTKLVNPDSWSESSKAKNGYIFLVIKFKCKNVGNYESNANIDTARVLTTKGYFYDSVAISYHLSYLQPGDERIDYIKFEIPKDQKAVRVYFKIGVEERILQLQ